LSEEHQNLVIWGRPNSGKSYVSHLITKRGQVDHALMRGTLFPKKDGKYYNISFLRRRIEDVFTDQNEKMLIFIRDPRISWICQVTGMSYHTLEEYRDHAEGAICGESLPLIKHYRENKDSIYVKFEDTLNIPDDTVDKINEHLNTSIEYAERLERYNSLITHADLEKMQSNGMKISLINEVFKHIDNIDRDFIEFFGYRKSLTWDEIQDKNL